MNLSNILTSIAIAIAIPLFGLIVICNICKDDSKDKDSEEQSS